VPWHARSVADVAGSLRVDPRAGLSHLEAVLRGQESGPNELEAGRRVSLLGTILRAIREPFVLLLALAGGLAVLLGEVRDGLLILGALVPIVGADVITEYRAERALEALHEAAAPLADVRRDGHIRRILARELVPGDVVLLRVGDIVPADLRVTRSDALTLDRSVLTGESLPEIASTAPDAPESAIVDRRSVAYAGTAVVVGRGEGIVVATGRSSELGRIAAQLGAPSRSRSPLQRELDRLVRILLVVAAGLIAFTVSAALLRGASLGSAVLAGIAAAIAAIPEEPPVLLAVVLGLGAYRLLRRGVLVRRLSAQETLGAIDLIITDKTGTLTENRLTLEVVLGVDGELAGTARTAAVEDAFRAEEDAWHTHTGGRRGSFTRALLEALASPPRLAPEDLLASQPPASDRPWSRTRVRRGAEIEELALGAPEAILELLDDPGRDRTAWRHASEKAARAGRRLLLLAGRPDNGTWNARALLGFSDPLREGIVDALALAAAGGIQTIVVTGDHPATAAEIARRAGLATDKVLTGNALEAMDDAALIGVLPSLTVVARASPEQKLRLVQAARASGRTVAVTGDGVNDAPALQHADVAVAMGGGTQVAREAADLVLGDDSFATLMGGLAEGRRIVANVEKGLVFLTSTHVALLGFILIATVAGFGHPLLPLQILWLELFIDLNASVAMEREPAEPGLMRRPPRPRDRPLLTRHLLMGIAAAGGATALGAFVLMLTADGSPEHARWLAFTALVFGQLARAWANRSLSQPVTRLPINGFMALACVVAAATQLLIPYLPALASAFDASPLSLLELLLIAAVALAPAVLAQLARMPRPVAWVA
jgi:Ca2+-transporting ATPase